MPLGVQTLRVYVAAKYSAPTDIQRLANTGRPILEARDLMKLGFHPFVPQLSHHIDPGADLFSWEMWMDWCLDWLIACDAMLVLSESKGVEVEKEFAEKNGIPWFRSITALLEWRKEKELEAGE
jgi:hypothetical protein